ncbi:hypothetical protein I3843_12G030700 [Carya illinoinensis]|nr:hypothetical protein I3843_12G030700 [Carya illinoinensis]
MPRPSMSPPLTKTQSLKRHRFLHAAVAIVPSSCPFCQLV